MRQAAADGHLEDPRDPDRARRRVRRQEQRLSRNARHRAVEEVQPAGQDDDEPGRRVPRHRSDLWRAHPDQDRLPQGRPHHRRRGPARLPGRRLRGLLGADGVDVHLHPLRPRKRQGGRQRHHGEPAQGRRLPRARSADLDLRRRKHPGRDVAGARHRPHRAPPEERSDGRNPDLLRSHLRADRLRGHPEEGAGASASQGDAGSRPGPRHRKPASGSTSARRPPPRSTSTRTAA